MSAVPPHRNVEDQSALGRGADERFCCRKPSCGKTYTYAKKWMENQGAQKQFSSYISCGSTFPIDRLSKVGKRQKR